MSSRLPDYHATFFPLPVDRLERLTHLSYAHTERQRQRQRPMLVYGDA